MNLPRYFITIVIVILIVLFTYSFIGNSIKSSVEKTAKTIERVGR